MDVITVMNNRTEVAAKWSDLHRVMEIINKCNVLGANTQVVKKRYRPKNSRMEDKGSYPNEKSGCLSHFPELNQNPSAERG